MGAAAAIVFSVMILAIDFMEWNDKQDKEVATQTKED